MAKRLFLNYFILGMFIAFGPASALAVERGKDYKTVVAECEGLFDERVKSLLNESWQLHGSVSAIAWEVDKQETTGLEINGVRQYRIVGKTKMLLCVQSLTK